MTAAARAIAAALAVAAALGAACQGGRRDEGGDGAAAGPGDGGGGSGGSGAASGSGSGAASGSGSGAATGSGSAAGGEGSGGDAAGARRPGAAPTDDDGRDAPPDPDQQIAELGAIPAWQAVVDRAQLLARRGQKGVVYGRVGPAVVLPPPPAPPAPPAAGSAGSASPVASPYVWLVDDTEGNGALGIRIALRGRAAAPGARIAASGAWELDEQRRWYWRVDAVQPLAPAPAPSSASAPAAAADPQLAVPGLVPPAAPVPPGAKPIRVAKDNEVAVFQIVGPPPARDGDGWLVANQLYEAPVALLIFPGERPSYGGQDLRSPDERWQLRRQVNYWVRLGRLRPQRAGEPVVIRARTPPMRVQ